MYGALGGNLSQLCFILWNEIVALNCISLLNGSCYGAKIVLQFADNELAPLSHSDFYPHSRPFV